MKEHPMDPINGTEENDILNGTLEDDIINGLGGDDTLFGSEGADEMNGGEGFDTVDYSGSASGINLAGNVFVGGDADGDILSSIEKVIGSGFTDFVRFNKRTEFSEFHAGDGDDGFEFRDKFGGVNNSPVTVFGGAGTDKFVFFNVGLDESALIGSVFDGGETADDNDRFEIMGSGIFDFTQATLTGFESLIFAGNLDNYFVTFTDEQFSQFEFVRTRRRGDLEITIEMGEQNSIDLSGLATNGGNATPQDFFIIGDEDAEQLIGSNRGDHIEGNGGNDSLDGGDGVDIVDGGEGDDSLNGGAGDDVMIGGAGVDFIDGGQNFDTVSYAFDTAGVIVNLDSVERLGLASNRALDGSGSIDTLRAIEFVDGSAFADVIYGSDKRNNLNGGAGDDELFGRGGDDSMIGGLGNDLLNGASGFDTVDYSSSTGAVDVNLSTGIADDGLGGTDTLVLVEAVVGSVHNDTITGSEKNEEFEGGFGDDFIFGGAGNDRLDGGEGNDTLNGDDDNDRLNGNDGDDMMFGGEGVDVFDGGLGNDTMFGGNDGDRMFGRDGNDVMFGGSGIDILNGQEGDDTLRGEGDRDFLRGGAGNDTLEGGEGDDRIDGGTEIDVAVYLGAFEDYEVIVRDNGLVSVRDLNLADGDEGFDLITNVEQLQFADIAFDLV